MKYKYFKFIRSKYFLLFLFIFLTFLSIVNIPQNALADSNVELTELSGSVNEIVNGLNLSEIQQMLDEMNDYNIFGGSIKNKIVSILNGNYYTDYSNIIEIILSIVFDNIQNLLPFIFTIVSIGILSNLISGLKSDNSSTYNIVNFVCFSVIVLMLIFTFKDILLLTKDTLSLILKQMQIVFPILITLLSTVGSVTTISIYNPMVAVLTFLVSVIFDKILYPLFIILFLLMILGGMSETVKLNKLQGFLMSTFKWSVGIVFTLFTGFLSLQGISAGKFDSISIKATKFAIKSYIPIIGSYISDGMDFLVLGSVLVKNTIGIVGLLILFITIISPVMSILLIKLSLQLVSGILEMTGAGKISNFIGDCSKVLVYPIVIIISVSFMYLITVALIMCTANIF